MLRRFECINFNIAGVIRCIPELINGSLTQKGLHVLLYGSVNIYGQTDFNRVKSCQAKPSDFKTVLKAYF